MQNIYVSPKKYKAQEQGEGAIQCQLITNHSNLVPLAPLPIFFFYKISMDKVDYSFIV